MLSQRRLRLMFESISPPTRPNWILRIVILALTVAVATGFVSLWRMTQMPLSPYKRPLPPLTEVQSEVASRLSGQVRYLSGDDRREKRAFCGIFRSHH